MRRSTLPDSTAAKDGVHPDAGVLVSANVGVGKLLFHRKPSIFSHKKVFNKKNLKMLKNGLAVNVRELPANVEVDIDAQESREHVGDAGFIRVNRSRIRQEKTKG